MAVQNLSCCIRWKHTVGDGVGVEWAMRSSYNLCCSCKHKSQMAIAHWLLCSPGESVPVKLYEHHRGNTYTLPRRTYDAVDSRTSSKNLSTIFSALCAIEHEECIQQLCSKMGLGGMAFTSPFILSSWQQSLVKLYVWKKWREGISQVIQQSRKTNKQKEQESSKSLACYFLAYLQKALTRHQENPVFISQFELEKN